MARKIKPKITNLKVFKDGDEISDWACDVDASTGVMESNAGVEHLVVYKSKVYTVVTDYNDEIVLNGDRRAKPVGFIDKKDFVYKLLVEAGYKKKGRKWVK